MLDVIAGYDPADPITAFSTGEIPPSYTESLDPNGLEGARIGLVLDLVGQDVIHEEVNAVVEEAIATMTEAGATVIRLRIPNFADSHGASRSRASSSRSRSIATWRAWAPALRSVALRSSSSGASSTRHSGVDSRRTRTSRTVSPTLSIAVDFFDARSCGKR